ncbi:protein asteroid homolog 1-like [Cydia pomonella]|uniref:protein asteroid homolog 1-like n=1 Tax=Cydia pomonella TaxID=82600 RepID=UPI002ADE1832|nr:protein asteroid homolog 1-like [Cydia pomonella]
MRIKSFGTYLETNEVHPRQLWNEPVVIDGHNFFFRTYEESGLAYELGCECDRYAAYLTHRLSMFHKANVQCYFLFKGGWKDMEEKLENNIKPPKAYLKRPVFTKNIIKEVLQQNNFQFVFCEYESKSDIIELAQTLNCPIISQDIEFCFSGHPYISIATLKYSESDNSIHCGIFLLKDFIQKHKLTEDKLATFIVLTDELIYPVNFFSEVYKLIFNGLVYGVYKRNLNLLGWLSRRNRDEILRTIFRLLSEEDRKIFLEKEIEARRLIERREFDRFGAACFLNRAVARVARADPLWFTKGVASAHIDQEYVNLYHAKHFYGSKALADREQDDAMVPSLEIVKYAFDLLTNFQNDGFNFVYDTKSAQQTMVVGGAYSIPPPAYEAEISVFENGWDSVGTLGLLEHFMRSTLLIENLRHAERVPESARLLTLALAYYSRRRPAAPAALPAVVLLTHVMLDVAVDNRNNNPIAEHVTETDSRIAAAIMEEYFNDVDEIDLKLLHPLVEYQLCVAQLSALNVLCGAELPPPVLARSYNATLAYRLLGAAQRAPDHVAFIDELLSPAPTVYAYFNGIREAYEDLLFVEAPEDL